MQEIFGGIRENAFLRIMLYGELLSILVAMTWTVTALCAEVASRRMGQLQMNLLRMAASLLILCVTLWVATGSPLPCAMSGEAWVWLLASGAVGYVFGDYCLFSSYVVMGSRTGQLFMTLAPLFSALAAWLLLHETLGLQALAGMAVTLAGIGLVIEAPGEAGRGRTIPLKGILFGIGAAMGQGVGIVLSKVGMGLCGQTPLLPKPTPNPSPPTPPLTHLRPKPAPLRPPRKRKPLNRSAAPPRKKPPKSAPPCSTASFPPRTRRKPCKAPRLHPTLPPLLNPPILLQ